MTVAPLFCRLLSIATLRDHFVRRLSVRPSVSLSFCPSVCHTFQRMFRRRYMHSSECCHYFYCPLLSRKPGDIKFHSSVPLSVCLSVTKTLNWLISSEVLMIEHLYLACMLIATNPFYWYRAVTLTFDLSQGQICCWAGDHSSSNLLVIPDPEGALIIEVTCVESKLSILWPYILSE